MKEQINWEECVLVEKPGRWCIRHATMSAKGEIAINQYLYELLNEPPRFLLLYDRYNRIIGLKPATNSTRNSFHISRRGRHGARLVRAFRLCQQFSIHVPHTVRFPAPEIDQDGVLRLDLRTAEPFGQNLHEQVEGQ